MWDKQGEKRGVLRGRRGLCFRLGETACEGDTKVNGTVES